MNIKLKISNIRKKNSEYRKENKNIGTDLDRIWPQNFKILFFHFNNKFLELINFIYCIFNVSSQFESQKLCYKQDTKFEFFFVMLTQFESCYCLRMWSIDIRFVQMLLSSVDYIIYEHIKLYATSYLVKEMVISYCTFVNISKIQIAQVNNLYLKNKKEKKGHISIKVQTL